MNNAVSLPFALALLAVLALFSFFFSAAETSIIGLSKIRLRHMIARGLKRAQNIQRLITKMDKFIVAILVGNNFVNVAISSIVTGILVLNFGYKWGIALATFITAFFILIICEITPKILAIKHTERIALFITPIMEIFIKIFNPIIFIFSEASNLIIKLLRIKPAKKSPLITEEELRLMIELGKEEGFVSIEEGKMLQRIFEFGDTKISDCMMPKEKIIAVDIKVSLEQLLDTFVEESHSRLPVYQGSKDNIIGIVYARDLHYILRYKELFLLQDLINEPYFVSSEAKVNDVLKKFQTDKTQIAIVVNEHKKVVGLVTLEDLMEEIVGEIEEKTPLNRVKKKV